MSSAFKIPLISGAQTFQIRLGGNLYKVTITYRQNARGGSWFLDMERADGSDAVLGMPLILGVDLLAQFKHKGFGTLWVTTDALSGERPTFDDMGTNISLYWSE